MLALPERDLISSTTRANKTWRAASSILEDCSHKRARVGYPHKVQVQMLLPNTEGQRSPRPQYSIESSDIGMDSGALVALLF